MTGFLRTTLQTLPATIISLACIRRLITVIEPTTLITGNGLPELWDVSLCTTLMSQWLDLLTHFPFITFSTSALTISVPTCVDTFTINTKCLSLMNQNLLSGYPFIELIIRLIRMRRILIYYPHMPKGKLWIYRLLFLCNFLCPQDLL